MLHHEHFSCFSFFFPPSKQKRSQPLEFIDPLANKKPRISHLAHRTQPTFNGKLNSSNGKDTPAPPALPPALPEPVSSSSTLPALELPRPHDPLSDVSNDLTHNGRDCESTEPPDRLSHPLPTDCAQSSKHNCGSYVKSKKKSKKHKDKEKERKEKKSEEKCKEEKQNCEVIKNADLVSVPQEQVPGEWGPRGAVVLAGCDPRIAWRNEHILGHPRRCGDPNASAALPTNHQRCFLSTEDIRFFLFNLSCCLELPQNVSCFSWLN